MHVRRPEDVSEDLLGPQVHPMVVHTGKHGDLVYRFFVLDVPTPLPAMRKLGSAQKAADVLNKKCMEEGSLRRIPTTLRTAKSGTAMRDRAGGRRRLQRRICATSVIFPLLAWHAG